MPEAVFPEKETEPEDVADPEDETAADTEPERVSPEAAERSCGTRFGRRKTTSAGRNFERVRKAFGISLSGLR